MVKKKRALIYLILTIFSVVCLSAPDGFSAVEWEMEDSIVLEDKPIAIVLSRDGSTAYFLCRGKILLYSTKSKKVTDTIPVEGNYSGIALTPNGEKLLLTDTGNKQIAVISISRIYDIKIGKSPIIGKKDAPVNIVAFLDFQ